MTNLTATPSWDDVIQLETTTIAEGGSGGVMNAQAQALLNRTTKLDQDKVSAADLASSAAGKGASSVGLDPGQGGTPTNIGIWVKQQIAVVENYPSLQSALNSGAKIVRLTEPSNLSSGVTIPAGVTLEGNGKSNVAVTCAANITPFTMSSVNDAALEGVLIIAHSTQTAPIILLDSATATMARCRVRDVQGSGSATDFPFISIRTRNGAYGSWAHEFHDISVSGCGTIIRCETQFANSWINSLNASHIHANDFIRGVHLISTAGDGCSDSTFFDWATQTSARTQFGALIADVSAQGISRKNSFTDIRFYDLPAGALGFYVGSNVIDTAIQGLTVDDLIPSRIRDLGVNTRIQGLLVPDYMTRGGRVLRLPTNAGLTAATSGTGTTQTLVQYAQLRTGSTAGSLARLYSADTVSGLSQNQLFNTDFGKPLKCSFLLTRIGAGASSVGRVQLKQTQADGALVAAGIGIQINNYDLYGESYGSSDATVNLGVTMADAQTYRVDIVHYPGVRVEWWVNGVLKGAQATAANIPSGIVPCYLQTSLSNVAANDVQMLFNAVELAAQN